MANCNWFLKSLLCTWLLCYSDFPDAWRLEQNGSLDALLATQLILYFSCRSIVDLKDGSEGGKKETKDFDAYAQCVDTNDMKDGNENGKETQSTLFQAYALDTDVSVWKMGMRRKEGTHTTSFQAYANLLGMSFPHWPSSEDTTYSQKNLRYNFLKLLFTSIAQKVFGVIMNIPITEIFASVFRRGISSYEHIDLSVVLDSGPKEASSCTAVAWHWCRPTRIPAHSCRPCDATVVEQQEVGTVLPTALPLFLLLSFILSACLLWKSWEGDWQNVYTVAHIPTLATQLFQMRCPWVDSGFVFIIWFRDHTCYKNSQKSE